MKNLGDRLKKLRIKRNESLQQIANKTGISKTRLWQLEAGNSYNPVLRTAILLAEHFDVTVSDLIGENQIDKNLIPLFKKMKKLNKKDLDLLKDIINYLLKR